MQLYKSMKTIIETKPERGKKMITEDKIIENILKEEENQEYKGHKISDLRKVMDRIQNKEDWKLEWAAFVPYQIIPIIMIAVEFFHADKVTIHGSRSLDGKILVSGNGYQAY